ncbi:MAG: T9SS type A sorting domain-containing protein, partial [Candidatus Cloacimonetes bacterium]|nr:T9SS type A sorting domain-containing protein [Candidatus Cloacimonadota bacterium]
LDTEIWLYGGNGTTELAHNDDAGQGIYQSTINFTISESATYYFKIGSYASFIGDYQVELSGIAELSTDDELELPRHYLKCYPNPFHTSTSIKFTTGKTGMNSEISIYNLKGQKVRTFSDLQNNKSPNQQIFWNGTGENGKPVSSGIYLYKFSTDDRCKTARMMILKSN